MGDIITLYEEIKELKERINDLEETVYEQQNNQDEEEQDEEKTNSIL